jgi:hypothetical protein
MSISLQIEPLRGGEPATHGVIRSPWGLIPVDWLALNIALAGECASAFPVGEPPYTMAGEAAFKRLLNLSAVYRDRVDDEGRARFGNLLLTASDRFLPGAAAGPDWTDGSVFGLRDETAELIRVVAAQPSFDGSETLAMMHALLAACETAVVRGESLRLRFVPDPRPAGAPIRPATAPLEGFSAIRRVRLDAAAEAVEIAFASGFAYRIPAAFIGEIEGFDRRRRLVAARQTGALPLVQLQFEHEEPVEWTWESVLTLCEPAYTEFAHVAARKRSVIVDWMSRLPSFRLTEPSAAIPHGG